MHSHWIHSHLLVEDIDVRSDVWIIVATHTIDKYHIFATVSLSDVDILGRKSVIGLQALAIVLLAVGKFATSQTVLAQNASAGNISGYLSKR